MLIYYFYNPKTSIEEKYLYADKIILTKKISIPSDIDIKYKNAGIELIKATKIDTNENLIATNSRDLIKYYHEIELNRFKYENLVRSHKIHFITSLIIPFFIVFIFVLKITNPLNSINLLLIYFIFAMTNLFLSIYLPSEQDIMLRPPRKKGAELYSKEEKLFIYANIFSFIAAITIPYMFVLYSTDKIDIINYVLLISITITNFVNLSYHLNDSPTLINIFKLLFNKY